MKSLRTKLVLFVLAISFVITIITSVIGMTSVHSTAQKTLIEMVTPLAVQTSETISSEIGYYTKAVSSLTDNSIIRNSNSTITQIKNQLTNETTSLKCSAYTLYDANDEPIVSFTNTINSDLPKMDSYIKAKTEGIITLSDPMEINDKKYFVITSPVKDLYTDENLYIFTAYYTFDKVNDIIAQISFGKTGRGYLINNTGLTVADPLSENENTDFNALEMAKTNNEYKELAQIYNDALANNSGSKVIKLDGKSQVAGYATVPNTDWYLIITAPKNEFVTNVASTILIFIISALVIFVIVSVVTMILVKNIVRPIINTTERLKSLSEGNLTDPVEITGQKNELGILSASLEETVYSLKQYIDKISDALTNIANGNLSFEMTGNFRGDFIKIKTSFNSILASLRNTFGNINNASEQVNTGASQVSNGAQALSQGAAQQANSIDMLSEQLQGISMQVSSNAQAATKTDSFVDNITNEISSCNEEMNKMLSSMSDINKSSSEISKIIKVIDDIAFQTNILALNATVEAARAGSAGKGFAVVADEVRNLAAKSAEAAKQTTVLIEDSVSNVKKGTKIAKDTAAVLDNIVEGAAQISKQVKLIANASHNQAKSVNEINASVQEISAVVQTNTATAEESAAASEELSSQSNLLSEMIGKFKFDGVFESEEDDYNSFSSDSLDFNTPANNTTAPAFDFGVPAEENKPFDFGSPAEENKPFDFGAPAEENKPFDFGSPAEENKPFDFDAPAEENKPFDFNTPADNSFDFEVPKKTDDNEDKPFEFDTPTQINLDSDSDFTNNNDKY